jgi:hypothetical protein
MKQMSAKAFQRTIGEYNAELFKQRLGAALEELMAC